MRRRFENFMQGRYGTDDFSRFLLIVCLILIVINLFTGSTFLYILALAALIYSYYRSLSRNMVKRSEENEKYLGILDNVKGFFQRSGGSRSQSSKDYHIYKCPSCGQKIRIPRGKGKICITCPKCGTEFQKRS